MALIKIRTGYIKHSTTIRNSHQTIFYYSQTNYTLCRSHHKKLLVNSINYGRTHIRSDHKIVVAQFNFSESHPVYPQHKPQKHVETLIHDGWSKFITITVKDLKNQLFLDVTFNKFEQVWMKIEEHDFCR